MIYQSQLLIFRNFTIEILKYFLSANVPKHIISTYGSIDSLVTIYEIEASQKRLFSLCNDKKYTT